MKRLVHLIRFKKYRIFNQYYQIKKSNLINKIIMINYLIIKLKLDQVTINQINNYHKFLNKEKEEDHQRKAYNNSYCH